MIDNRRTVARKETGAKLERGTASVKRGAAGKLRKTEKDSEKTNKQYEWGSKRRGKHRARLRLDARGRGT